MPGRGIRRASDNLRAGHKSDELAGAYSAESTNESPALRVGCVKYLNARPLIYGWPGSVALDHPAALCVQLAGGDLDVALVSSFEFLRNPIYRVVDDICISSDGPVYSVVVAHVGEISEIEEVELDSASETSVNLLRCLLAEAKLVPRIIPASTLAITARRARLLIGDQAIRFRLKHAHEFRFWDLGEQWKKLVGLPFVYALWLVRPEVADPREVGRRLRALRDGNMARLNKLISAVVSSAGNPDSEEGFDSEFCARYYREHVRFSFGEREKEGLRTFAGLCTKHRLLPKGDVAFDLV